MAFILTQERHASPEACVGNGTLGHRDWLYDEFRLGDDGHILHEIEWSGPHETARWLIEASDVEFTWVPREAGGNAPAA